MMQALEVAVLGGFGATLRYLLDNLITRRWGANLPWGTMAINVLGSLCAGLVLGAYLQRGLGVRTDLLLATGLLGGFTTASTFAVEVARLAGRKRLGSSMRA
jgi:CrcB protein